MGDHFRQSVNGWKREGSIKEKVQRATRNMFKQQEHTLLPFPTHSMARKKTVCCGGVAILVVLATGACVTLITLMYTRKTAPGKKKHTLTTASQMPADGKLKSSLLQFCLSDRAGANPCAQPRDRT